MHRIKFHFDIINIHKFTFSLNNVKRIGQIKNE